MLKPVVLICDANVLIDFVSADKKVFHFLNKLYKICIPEIIIKEVNELDMNSVQNLGIEVFDTPFEIIESSVNAIPGCSFQDTICYHIAKTNGWLLATNDKKLRRECKNSGVSIIWGLQLLLQLIKNDLIDSDKAIKIVKKISDNNREISSQIVEDFIRKAEELQE